MKPEKILKSDGSIGPASGDIFAAIALIDRLWNKKWVLVAIALTGAVLGFVSTLYPNDTYKARSIIQVGGAYAFSDELLKGWSGSMLSTHHFLTKDSGEPWIRQLSQRFNSRSGERERVTLEILDQSSDNNVLLELIATSKGRIEAKNFLKNLELIEKSHYNLAFQKIRTQEIYL